MDLKNVEILDPFFNRCSSFKHVFQGPGCAFSAFDRPATKSHKAVPRCNTTPPTHTTAWLNTSHYLFRSQPTHRALGQCNSYVAQSCNYTFGGGSVRIDTGLSHPHPFNPVALKAETHLRGGT
jgi:hypothetical protein